MTDFNSSSKSKHQPLKSQTEIEAWLKEENIKNYTLHFDGSQGYTVDVDGSVELGYRQLDFIPVRFGRVSGGFDCWGNNLTTLENAPRSVGAGFNCNGNLLSSLEGGPLEVGYKYSCSDQKPGLLTLKGAPVEVNGDFNCSGNLLTTLAFGPKVVSGNFKCIQNHLTTLEYSPQKVGKEFDCSCNKLVSLKGIETEIYGSFFFTDNQIQDLRYFPSFVSGQVLLRNNVALGDLQKETDFKTVYAHHMIEQEKMGLEKAIDKIALISGVIKPHKI